MHLGSGNDSHLRVVGSLLVQILSEPAFNVLRTQEQLGYIVSCSQWRLPGDVYFGIRILVQSERHPTYLEERVEAFLDVIKDKLETMPDKEFLEQKTGLEGKWRERAKNLVEETNRYWDHIESGDLDFHRRVYFDLMTSEHSLTSVPFSRGQRRRYAEACDERGSTVTLPIERTSIFPPEG